jgi:HEPN domain-containing protein
MQGRADKRAWFFAKIKQFQMEQYTRNVSFGDGNAREVVSRILKILNPEKIICFGSRVRALDAWSSFVPQREKSLFATYDLLIITRVSERRSRHELLDMLDSSLSDSSVTATVLVHGIDTVNQALLEGSVFFGNVCRTGSILYDNGETALVTGQANHRSTDIGHMEQVWGESFGLAKQFLNGALHFSWSSCNNIAVFMLHQAIEQTCNALVRIMTGYRPATHNLSRLLAMTENFSTLSCVVFPRNTPEEKDLFKVVARAYSDVRYKQGFKVPASKTLTLIERVASLQGDAEKLYKDRLHQAVQEHGGEIPNVRK